MSGSLCIHGHFYQPPRENPFTGIMQSDEYAQKITGGKYSNWNEIICNECYKPNAEAGNFSLMTFDLYRTLAEWVETYDPSTYKKIIDESYKNYLLDGVGSAFCGSWNHSILPLLKDEDIELEIYWGCQDFRKRFGYEPIGFWLAETAVSKKVLDVLAKNGIRLVILAPWQVENPVDTSKLYWTSLYEGRRICISFYDKDLSDGLSFDSSAMQNADGFVNKYIKSRNIPDKHVILGATDGERYGHHFKSGEKFLNYLMNSSVPNAGYQRSTIIKSFLETPITDEVFIRDFTSWSCLCGDLKRWKEDCSCSVDYNNYNKRVNGSWKSALFKAIHTLSENIDTFTNNLLLDVIPDLYNAKKEYVKVYLKQMEEKEFEAKYIPQHSVWKNKNVLKILDMHRYRLASFTSCGWFFEDVDRPEPRIVIGNAKKALSVLSEVNYRSKMIDFEEIFVSQLSEAKSNKTTRTGKDLYLEYGQLLSAYMDA
jgi:alpha-amylase/alpha-mannosidase (GH57 family)